jgi:hypothetical protein
MRDDAAAGMMPLPMTTPREEKEALPDCVGEFLGCIEAATMPQCRAFADGAILDATVPNWRFTVSGGTSVRDEFARWYADSGRFEEVQRAPLPDGELVEFVLTWQENGIPHTCHQAHRLEVRDDHIVRDTVWCGGRWPASLLAEMEAAANAG